MDWTELQMLDSLQIYRLLTWVTGNTVTYMIALLSTTFWLYLTGCYATMIHYESYCVILSRFKSFLLILCSQSLVLSHYLSLWLLMSCTFLSCPNSSLLLSHLVLVQSIYVYMLCWLHDCVDPSSSPALIREYSGLMTGSHHVMSSALCNSSPPCCTPSTASCSYCIS